MTDHDWDDRRRRESRANERGGLLNAVGDLVLVVVIVLMLVQPWA